MGKVTSALAAFVLSTASVTFAAGASGIVRPPLPDKVAVLTIHGVPDLVHPWVNTPPDLFTSYMKFLKENGYTVISMRDLGRYVDAEKARAAPSGRSASRTLNAEV